MIITTFISKRKWFIIRKQKGLQFYRTVSNEHNSTTLITNCIYISICCLYKHWWVQYTHLEHRALWAKRTVLRVVIHPWENSLQLGVWRSKAFHVGTVKAWTLTLLITNREDVSKECLSWQYIFMILWRGRQTWCEPELMFFRAFHSVKGKYYFFLHCKWILNVSCKAYLILKSFMHKEVKLIRQLFNCGKIWHLWNIFLYLSLESLQYSERTGSILKDLLQVHNTEFWWVQGLLG